MSGGWVLGALVMGTFHVSCVIANHTRRQRTVRVSKLLVDTGSDYTWIPESALKKIGVAEEKKDLAVVMATGQTIHATWVSLSFA